jgi:acyl-CoA synthetase (AMP-forming)/AMP-acid ligase II
MIIPETIYNTTKLYGDKEAIICSEGRFTYNQFKEHIDLLSAALHESLIRKGDRVAVLHMNCHIFLELYYAVAQIGAILVPLNTRLVPRELSFMIEDSGSRFLFSEYQFLDKIRQIQKQTDVIERVIWTKTPAAYETNHKETTYNHFLKLAGSLKYEEKNIDPDDAAQIFYTSGSTGRPKGVIMTHKNMVTHALGTLWEYQVTDEDVWGHVAPLFHMSDICNGWAMTWAGTKQVFVGKFDTNRILDEMEREKFTLLKMVPTMWTMLLNNPTVEKRDFSALRLVVSGGAPIAPELVRKIIDTFQCEYVQNYGMTEATHFLTISRLKDSLKDLPPDKQLKYKAKTGRPFIGVQIRVVDEKDQDIETDGVAIGEIIVKGDIITPGYWNLPEENARSFRNGWLYTEDLATVDGEGYLQIMDRKKDMIVSGGENVYSIEVEQVLHYHPSVIECSVLGVPHPKWGEAVMAVCVLREGAPVSEEDIISKCKEYLAPYKAPKSVEFLKELPKTGSGKIYKKGLRDSHYKLSQK